MPPIDLVDKVAPHVQVLKVEMAIAEVEPEREGVSLSAPLLPQVSIRTCIADGRWLRTWRTELRETYCELASQLHRLLIPAV